MCLSEHNRCLQETFFILGYHREYKRLHLLQFATVIVHVRSRGITMAHKGCRFAITISLLIELANRISQVAGVIVMRVVARITKKKAG